jgi:hypothetical protein
MHTAMIYPTSHNIAKERLLVNRPDGIAELSSQKLAGAGQQSSVRLLTIASRRPTPQFTGTQAA